jgi:GMP synthase (glutamine-hydrolysing)
VATVGVNVGGVVDRAHAEPISAVRITLTEAGRADPVLAGVPPVFDAFVGHKEACRVLPPTAVLLATSPACPVQMFRVKSNVYATQFHPELDVPGIVTRIHVYRHAGYFAPAEMDEVIRRVTPAVVTEPGRTLANFVARYA